MIMTATKKPDLMLKAPIFYILMRRDMESMNPGKAMAQASHAYGALRKAIKEKLNIQPDFIAWMDTTEQDFGTTIVLGSDEGGIGMAIGKARKNILMCSGWVHDPTYPVRDGRVTHAIPVNTCAFIFGEAHDVFEIVERMELHP